MKLNYLDIKRFNKISSNKINGVNTNNSDNLEF